MTKPPTVGAVFGRPPESEQTVKTKRMMLLFVSLSLAGNMGAAETPALTASATARPNMEGVLVLREQQPVKVQDFCVVATPDAGVSRAPATSGAPAKQATSATLSWDKKALSPQDYLDELKAHLEAIRQFLAFMQDARKVERLKQEGASCERIEAAIQALPVVTQDPGHATGLETWACEQKIQQLRVSKATETLR